MIECFFDCSSPWTYLGFHNVQPLAREFGQELVWKPILVGGIFNTVNPGVYEARANPIPLRWEYMLKDLADWADLAGLKIKMKPTVFPVNSVKAMRGCVWLNERDPEEMQRFARAVFEIYWGDDRDISQDEVLTEVCQKVGLDPAEFFSAIAQQDVKDKLRANTDELMARNGYGSPTFFLDTDDMFFGNDRLQVIREKLLRRNGN